MSLFVFLIVFANAIVMAVGRFLLISSIKSEKPLNSYGFLISLAASLGAALTAYLSELGAMAFFYVFLANVYGLYWVFSGFGFSPCPMLLKPGVARSARWVLFPLYIASVLAATMTFLGNDLGAQYGAWLSLGIACLAFCGLYRKGLSHRAYGIFLLSSLICMGATAGPALAAMLVLIQLPWFLPAIRRPAAEADISEPDTPEPEVSEPELLEPGVPPLLMPEETIDTEAPDDHQKTPKINSKVGKVRNIVAISRKSKKRHERIEPSIETLADIPDLDR